MKSTWNSRQGWTLNEVSDEEFLAFTMLLNSHRKHEGVSLMKHVTSLCTMKRQLFRRVGRYIQVSVQRITHSFGQCAVKIKNLTIWTSLKQKI